MTAATLYGSLTSPYARFCRLVRHYAGAEESVSFEVANPFDDDIRRINPLGKVPALIFEGGPALLETTLIARTIDGLGATHLLPQDTKARLQEEADVALAMGILDLGVAFRLEVMRDDPATRSARWQKRRLEGIAHALPALNEAAGRANEKQPGFSALAITATADWLSFRLAEDLPWKDKAARAASLTEHLLAEKPVASTDPRRA